MKVKILIWFLIMAVIPAWAFAQEKSMKHHQMHGMTGKQCKAVTSVLNEDQIKKWKETGLKYKKEQNEIKAKLKNARLDRQHLMMSRRVPDENAVNEVLDKIKEYSDQLQKNVFAQQLAFRKLITDEQWKEIQKLHKEEGHKTQCTKEKEKMKIHSKQLKH